MSKTLRTAAVIVGVVALVATGVGAAAGAGLLGATATAAAAGSAAAGASAIGGFITAAATVAGVATAASTALAVGAQLTAQPPPLQGNALSFNASIDAGIPYLIGRTATRGSIIYRRTHSTPGYSLPDLQSFGIILGGGGPYQSIESFTADGVTVGFTGAGEAIGSYANWMWQTQQLGASPESAALKVSTAKGYAPGWSASSKLSGYAAAMWTVRFDSKGKFYNAGLPKPLWVGNWALVYDPRLDSTYPGGSGSCRANVESSYVWSENPWLHSLTFALGRYQNGRRVLGGGYPPVGIDIAAFVEAANVADANAWKIGGLVLSTDDKWVVLQNMAQAGGGAVIHLGARLSCVVNTPRVALATVTTADVAGKASAAGTRTRRGRFNTGIPKFRSEAHGWEIIAGSAVPVAAHIATDGGERRREITYPLVQDLTQAQQLIRYAIENSREFEPVTLPLKIRWMGYKPGDCIAANLPEIGLNGQAMIIIGRSIDPESGVVTLTLRSETAGKHAFALGQTGTAPPTPSLTAPPVAPQPTALEWAITGNGLVAGDSVTPALIVTGGTVLPVDGIVFEYRQWTSGMGADDGWVTAGIQPAGATRAEITALLPGTQYQVAVSYRLAGLNGDRRVLGPTATAGAGVAWTSVTGTGRPDDNADVTAANTAAAIVGQGALATQNNVDWATQIIGAAKVAGNLLTDPITLTDLYFPDGNASLQTVPTGARLADRFRVLMTANTYFGWMANPGSTRIPVSPGQTIFYQHAVFTTNGTGSTRGLFNALNAEGNYVGTYEFAGSSLPASTSNFTWTIAKGSIVIPAGVAFIWPHAGGTSLDSPAYFGEPFVGYHAAGADITAINVAAAIAGQGALATLNSADWTTRVSGTGKPANNADVTAANIAAGIAGQGAMATQPYARSAVGWMISEGYDFWLTNGVIVTNQGTAAAIAGQGALATRNTVDWAADITGKPAGFGQVTVGSGETIKKWLEPYQAIAVEGGHGATGSTASFGYRNATLVANGSVFATGDAWYAGPSEPGSGEVTGTFTNGATAQLVTFNVSFSGSAVAPDTTKIFCRA